MSDPTAAATSETPATKAPKAPAAPRPPKADTALEAAAAAPLPTEPKPSARRAQLAGVPMTIVVAHGTYCGPGCPDVEKRLRDEDAGYEYTREHPAIVGEPIKLDKAVAKRMLAKESSTRRDWSMGGKRPPRIGSPFYTVEQHEATIAAETYVEDEP
jgi:hypothetical protein